MASQMVRITAGDLIEILEKIPKKEYIGYIMSTQDGVDAPANQVVMLNKQLPGTEIF